MGGRSDPANHAKIGGIPLAPDQDLGLDLDGDAERKRGHADGGSRVPAGVLAEQAQYQIREAVDHRRLAVEAGRLAFLAVRIPRRMSASASSPLEGVIGR